MFTVTLSEQQINTIKGMCDLALKQGGLQNLEPVLEVLRSLGRADEVKEKVTNDSEK